MASNLERGRTLHSLCYFIEDLSNKKQILKYERRYELPVLGFNEKVAVLSNDTNLLAKVPYPVNPDDTPIQTQPKQISGKQIILKTDNVSGKKFIVVQGKKLEVVQIQKNAEQFEIVPGSAPCKNKVSLDPTTGEFKAKFKIKNSQLPPTHAQIRLKNIAQMSPQPPVNPSASTLPKSFTILPDTLKQMPAIRFVNTAGAPQSNKIVHTGGTRPHLPKTKKKPVCHAQTSTEGLVRLVDTAVQTDDLETRADAKKPDVEGVSREDLLEDCSSKSSSVLSQMDVEYLLDERSPIVGKNVDFGSGPHFGAVTQTVVACDEKRDCETEKPHGQTNFDAKKMKFIKDLEECTNFDVGGNMEIHNAAIKNLPGLVKKQCFLLCVRQQSINITNYDCYTPLQLSVLHGSKVEIVQTLLQYGGEIEILDAEGHNVIHLAVLNSSPDVLEVLAKHAHDKGITVDSFNNEGCTPLMTCAANNKAIMAQILLNYGADPNMKDRKSGRTSLFHAVEADDFEMVKLLMDRGADPKVRNFFGTSTHDALFEIENISTEITMLVYGKNAAKSRPKGGAKGSQKVSPVQPIKRPLDEVDSYFEKLPKLQVVRKLQKVYSNKKHLQKRL